MFKDPQIWARSLLRRKTERGATILDGPPKNSELKEGQSIKRFVKGSLIEYVKHRGEVYAKGFDKTKKFSAPNTSSSTISTPNYDSGWIEIVNSENYDFNHSLGTKFLMIQAYIRGLSHNPDEVFNVTNAFSAINDDNGTLSMLSFFMKDNTTINVGTGNHYVFTHDNTSASSGGTFTNWANAHLRLFCWKFQID